MAEIPERRSYDHELGDLSARMKNVETWLESVSGDVKAIRSTLDRQLGGWKALAALATLSGSLGAFIANFFFTSK